MEDAAIVADRRAYLIGTGFIVFVINIMWSSSRGRQVQGDPWPVLSDQKAAAAAPAPAE